MSHALRVSLRGAVTSRLRRSACLRRSCFTIGLGFASVFAALSYLVERPGRIIGSSAGPAGPKPLPQTFRQHLLQLLGNFTALADSLGLEYWMCSGTLLGAVRDGGLIPWDDDVDLCVTRDALERLCRHVRGDGAASPGVRVYLDDGFVYKFVFVSPRPRPRPIFVDLFVMEPALQSAASPSSPMLGWLDRVLLGPIPTPILQYNMTRQREFWPFEYWFPSEVYPLKNYTFEGVLQVRGPADPISYLNRVYGSRFWGMLPRWLPTGQSGVAPGRSWQEPLFTYQHYDHS
jgi:hypothetical protein